MTIGDRIKYYRKAVNLTQAELAEMVGLSPSAIRMYETNKREPKMDTLQKICITLNIPITEFFINELEKKFPSAQLNRESKEIELIEQLLNLYGYRIKHIHIGATTEEEAEAIAHDKTIPLIEIINSKNENVILTFSDWDLLTNNLKKFFEFELFKLK